MNESNPTSATASSSIDDDNFNKLKSDSEVKGSKTDENDDDSNQNEYLLLIEFTDSNEAKYAQENSAKFDALDIVTKNPIIQIGNRLYSGEYQNNIGTYMFFEQKEGTPSAATDNEATLNTSTASSNAQTESKSSYSYYGKSYKKLILTRLYMKPRDETIEDESDDNNDDNK